MIENLFIFAGSIFLIIKGATLATKYSFEISKSFKLSKYIVGFILVAVISIIPETLVSVNSAMQGVSSLGLSSLFGGNIADMTLVFAIIIFFAGRGIKIESKILKENILIPFILLIPIILGLDGYYSRVEGLILIIVGSIFYYMAFKKNKEEPILPEAEEIKKKDRRKDILLFLFSMSILMLGSHFVISSTINLANYIGINYAVIGMLIIGVGTTMPELFFCLSAIKKDHYSLAMGDILGTVLADGTIVIGILVLINPFSFQQKIIYSTGIFMIMASFLLFYFMKTGKFISKKESYLLLSFWILFAAVEIILNI